MSEKPEGFCTQCGKDIESFAALHACPFCGTVSIPCLYEEQVDININMHELRLILIWAEQWARTLDDPNVPFGESSALCVYSIANRLRRSLPEKFRDAPLTLAAEIDELKKQFPNMETNFYDKGHDFSGDTAKGADT